MPAVFSRLPAPSLTHAHSEMTETLYVSGQVPDTDCHVTFAFRAMCDASDKAALLDETTSLFQELLPISFHADPSWSIRVGKQGELDAYKVAVVDGETRNSLRDFWEAQQRRRPGQRMFPFNLHVTLKSEQRKLQMVPVVTRGGFVIDQVTVKILETKECIKTVSSI